MPQVRIIGKVRVPGATVTGGAISARLSQSASASDARALGGGTSQPRVAAIGPDGSVDFTLDANDALVPSGTHYVVQVYAELAGGVPYRPPAERWQLASAPAEIDIAAVPRLGVVPGVAVTPASAITEQARAAAEALAAFPAAAPGRVVGWNDAGELAAVQAEGVPGGVPPPAPGLALAWSSEGRLANVPRRHAGFGKIVRIYDRAVPIPATPGEVLIDEVVELLPHGHIAQTARHLNPSLVIEKPDGNGGWIATNRPTALDVGYDPQTGLPLLPSFIPSADPEGYEVETAHLSEPPRPLLPGGDPPPEQFQVVAVGQDVGSDYLDESDQRVRVRVYVRRTQREYSPEEQAAIDQLGYRARFVIEAMDLVAWEKEVPIPALAGELVMDETLDLADFGAVANAHRVRFVAELRRGGRTIAAPPANGTSTLGEQWEPPGPPVLVAIRNQAAGTPWWNNQNGGALIHGKDYDHEVGGFRGFDRGVALSDDIADCSNMQAQRLRVVAWRHLEPVTEYEDGSFTGGTFDLSTIDARLRGTLRVTGHAPVTMRFQGPAGEVARSPFIDLATGEVVVEFTPDFSTLGSVRDALVWARVGVEMVDVLSPDETLQATNAVSLTVPGPVLASVPVPPGSAEGCTLRVRLLVATPAYVDEFPFRDAQDNDAGSQVLRLRPLRPGSRTIPEEGVDGILWWDGATQTLRLGSRAVQAQ